MPLGARSSSVWKSCYTPAATLHAAAIDAEAAAAAGGDDADDDGANYSRVTSEIVIGCGGCG